MPPSLELQTEGRSVILRISDLDEEGVHAAKERLEEVQAILSTIVTFDVALESLPEGAFQARAKGCFAMDLKYQYALELAKQAAKLCLAVATGAADPKDHGFPELDPNEQLNAESSHRRPKNR